MGVSEVNSLAQDSVEVRRCTNASSIRSDSVVYITGIPQNTSSLCLRVWLSHSAAVQFLDHKCGDATAHARFASKSERDFFLVDWSKIGKTIAPSLTISALNENECANYFEAERERRRNTPVGTPPETPVKRQRTLAGNTHTSVIPVMAGHVSKPGCAFTDIITGNPGTREPKTSITYGIKKGRHIAREHFLTTLEKPDTVATLTHPVVDVLQFIEEPPSPPRRVKRARTTEKTSLPNTKTPRKIKKTRRGRRGGKHVS